MNVYRLIDIAITSEKSTNGAEIMPKGLDIIQLRLHNKAMNKSIELPTLECLRCGHIWIPRKPVEPNNCPKCISPYWNKPKWKQSGPQRKVQL
jgi:predicted Zn-ribbon and HTH transcriptional regulator